jgi:hypothetical protein
MSQADFERLSVYLLWHTGAQATQGTGAMRKKNVGSSIDDFLKKEGIFAEVQAQAIKEVVAWQLAKATGWSWPRSSGKSSPEVHPGQSRDGASAYWSAGRNCVARRVPVWPLARVE